MFKHGIVNVHPSLLPKYRGASPIQYALMNGDDVTGVSVMGLSDGAFDLGPVLAQRKVPVPSVCPHHNHLFNYPYLVRVLILRFCAIFLGLSGPTCCFSASTTCLMRGATQYPRLQLLNFITKSAVDECLQESLPEAASRAPRIEKDMGFINWAKMSAAEVIRRHRALSSQIGMRTYMFSSPIELCDMDQAPPRYREINGVDDSIHPGRMLYAHNQRSIVIQ